MVLDIFKVNDGKGFGLFLLFGLDFKESISGKMQHFQHGEY